MSYSIQAPDLAYAREQDGGGDWMYMDPTPGLSNTTIMSIKEGTIQPKSFKLAQNYPNPFNPVTTLQYDLPENALVNITIHDMTGRVVRNLINSQQSAGFKLVRWNATNDNGAPASAGVYLYKIQVGDFVDTRKMILLK